MLKYILIGLSFIVGCRASVYHPNIKHEYGKKLVSVSYISREKIDKQIDNKAIYYQWSVQREEIERNNHPHKGYLVLKPIFFNDHFSPTETYICEVLDRNENRVECFTFSPGIKPYTPSLYRWEYFRQNQKIVLPLEVISPTQLTKVIITNIDRRMVQIISIRSHGKKSHL